MINLLSPDDKLQLRAARSNVLLLRYTILIIVTIVAVGLVFGSGFFITMQERTAAEQQQQNDSAKTAGYSTVRKNAEAFAQNLTTAKKIISQEIIYSKLLTDIAKTLPRGSVLADLSLNPDSLGKSVPLSARTKNYDGALRLKNTLEESALFADVSIVSINRDEARKDYPVSVNLNVTITTDTAAVGATP